MNHYRVYHLGQDDRIKDGCDLYAQNDADALSQACCGADKNVGLEVWKSVRLVGRYQDGRWVLGSVSYWALAASKSSASFSSFEAKLTRPSRCSCS